MILRLVIGSIFIYLLFKFFRLLFPKVRGNPAPGAIRTAVAGEELVEDPCCHAYVPIGNARRMQIRGETFYFCSIKCLEQYKSKLEG